jgi:periplasmic protein TonB
MAYADQQMSGNRITALIVVGLLHVALGYALVTGLAFEGMKAVVKRLTTVDIKEEVKKDEPPPPPKKDTAPPPPVAPPVKINVQTTPPQIQTTVTPPPPAPTVYVATPAPPAPPGPPPPPPPPPRGPDKQASPKGNPGGWASPSDYPQRELRDEKEGVTRFRVTVSAEGRVTSCDITGSSGSPGLDSTTCSLITRRGRFNPAQQDGQPVAGSWSSSVRWVIPKE